MKAFLYAHTANLVLFVILSMCGGLYVLGRYIAKRRPVDTETQQALDRALANLGYSNENQQERLRAARIGLAVLLFIFIGMPAMGLLNEALVHAGCSYSMRLLATGLLLALVAFGAYRCARKL